MLKLIEEFILLFALKEKPQDIPYSKALVGLLVCCFVVTNVPLNITLANFLVEHSQTKLPLLPLKVIGSLTMVVSYIAIMALSIYAILSFYNYRQRFVQTVASLLGVEIILSLWFWALLVIPLSPFTVIFFILLLYWQFMVHIHIFSNSFSCTLLKAGLFALLYILLQHNVSEILLAQFMHGA